MPPSTPTTERAVPAPAGRRRGRGAVTGLALLTGVAVVAAGGVYAWTAGHLGGVPVRRLCTATAGGGTHSLSPEQAGNAAVITSIAVSRGLPARAATIGIATSIQESKLENIDYGDRDSVGLFQQRPSQGWGSVEEILDPVYSANAFYDVLVEIEGYESAVITDVAQQVQRSAFPSAYADHEPEARILASSLSGYSPASLDCVLRPVPEDLAAQTPTGSGFTERAQRVVDAASRETGRTAPEAVDASGTGIRFALTGAESGRLGWSLAQWAVARADGLDVVEVRTDGRRWQRSEPGTGWTPAPAVAAGTVEIVVAAGGSS